MDVTCLEVVGLEQWPRATRLVPLYTSFPEKAAGGAVGSPGCSWSVDAELTRQLLATGFEVVEADLAVVECGVEVCELGEDLGLVDLGGLHGLVGLVGLFRPLSSSLLLGLLLGLLVAIALQLPEGGAPA